MKKSKYANIIRHDGNYLVHNSLFGGAIKAQCDDSRAFFDAIESDSFFDIDENNEFHQEMKNMRMVVEDDLKEDNLANFYFMQRQQYELFLILIVTRQCNFRCVYCYEDHRNQIMSEETYNDVLSAIEKLIDLKGYKSLHVSFFGGEPMLEYDSICKFSEKVNALAKEKDINFYGSFTTNAYLLTEERLKKLVSLNLKEYQITIDGLENTHNRLRPLADGYETWGTIMENMLDAKASDLEFAMTLRTNFDGEVRESSQEYLEFMSERFKGDKRFRFHFEGVKKLGGKDDDTLDVVVDEVDAINEMTSSARKFGLNTFSTTYFLNPFGLVCYASKDDSFTIDFDGTLMKCTVHIDEEVNRIGSISNGKIDVKDYLMAQWTSNNLKPQCATCKILPICYNKRCPIAGRSLEQCNEYIKIYEGTLKSLYLMDASQEI